MRVRVVYTGGTIGGTGAPVVPMEAARFRALWDREIAPTLPEGAEVSWRWLDPPLDSSAMTPADWAALARLVLEAATEGAEAVILLHGTDTMAASAAALAFLTTLIEDDRAVARLPTPVILTGSQRPLFGEDGIAPGTDAAANIATAFAAAGAAGPGVHLAFAGEVLPGPRALKVSTRADRAFACPSGAAAPVPLPAADPASLVAALDRIASHLGRRAVLTVTPGPNADDLTAAALRGACAALGDRLGAVLLLGYGLGNIPAREALTPVIESLRARSVPVVVGTQVPSGGVAPSTYGAGNWLAAMGALPAGDMTVPAAQAKLHLALALAALENWGPGRIEAFLAHPLAGEIAA